MAICQLSDSTKQGEKAHSSKDIGLLPAQQPHVRLHRHCEKGKRRRQRQRGWKQNNRFIWQPGFLNEHQAPEALSAAVPKPLVLKQALDEQGGTC